MLVLSRKRKQRILLSGPGVRIWIQIMSLKQGRVKLGIQAPDSVNIARDDYLPPQELADGPPIWSGAQEG